MGQLGNATCLAVDLALASYSWSRFLAKSFRTILVIALAFSFLFIP
jgi:hypothetical protein